MAPALEDELGDRPMSPAVGPDSGCREGVGHVIVCGLLEVGLRTVEQLHAAGARVVVLDDDADARVARVLDVWGIPRLARGAHLT